MKMRTTWSLLALIAMAACGGGEAPASGQEAAAGPETAARRSRADFEGVLRQRMIELNYDDAYEVLGEAMDGSPEAIANRLAEVSIDAIVGAPGSEVQTMVLYIKGALTRAQPDMADPPMFQIIDAAEGSMWSVDTQSRSYFEFTQETARQMEEAADRMLEEMGIDPDEVEAMEESAPAGRSTSMGRSEEVNGVQATAYRYDDDEQVVVGWCAEDETGFAAAMQAMLEASPFTDEEEDVSDVVCPDGQLPVRTLAFRHFAGHLEVDEILSISRESVSDDMFEVPAGFTKQQLPGMPGN